MRQRAKQDLEVVAMNKIMRILNDLSEEARTRVLEWVVAKNSHRDTNG